jgi:hypothetical protein
MDEWMDLEDSRIFLRYGVGSDSAVALHIPSYKNQCLPFCMQFLTLDC